MKGLKSGLDDFCVQPFLCVEDAEEYLRSNGVDVEKILREAEECVVEWEERIVEGGGQWKEDGGE
jgi:hypothetical protein